MGFIPLPLILRTAAGSGRFGRGRGAVRFFTAPAHSGTNVEANHVPTLRAYPSRPLHRYVMKAHTRWSMPK